MATTTDTGRALPIAWTPLDQRIWEEELDPVVPARLFDVHTHVYLREHIGAGSPELQTIPFAQLYPSATWDDLDAADALLMPGRTIHRTAFGFPFLKVDFDAINRFTIRESRKDSASGAFLLVHPRMTQAQVEEQILHEGFLGLKPYRLYSTTGDVKECRITDYFPEHQMAVADRYELPVILQLSKSRGVADPDNIGDLERLTAKYPRVKWVLAHCARGFYPQPLERVGERLAKLPGVYFDTAAVCEYGSYDYLLELVGPGRILWGSDDLPACADRGKYMTWGEGWSHINADVIGGIRSTACDLSLTFIRYEVLRALCRAIRRHRLSPPEVQAIFHDNAAAIIDTARRNVSQRKVAS